MANGRWGRGRRLTGGALAILLLALLAWPVLVAGQTRPQRVLLINSYHEGLDWTDSIVAGVEEVLNSAPSNIHLYVEYMDALRFEGERYERIWYDLLSEKYGHLQPDIVLVSDDEAFAFVLAHRDALFPRTPIVFCGVNAFEEGLVEGLRDRITGVIEDVSLDETLDLALTLHPEARQVIAINDGTQLGKIYYSQYRELVQRYDDAVRFRYYEDPLIESLLDSLRQVRAGDTIVLVLSFSRDSDHRFYPHAEAMQLLAANTEAPIYGLRDAYLGHGLMGGKLVSGRAQGEAAARIALRILDGESPANIPVTGVPNVFMLDYQQLQRFGIEQGLLPGYNPRWPGETATIIGAPPSFVEQYGLPLLVGGVVLLVGGIIVAVQYSGLQRVRETESELRQSNLELEAVRTSLEERVDARTRDLAKRTEQLELASAVTRDIAAIHDLDELLRSVVNLISERFGFYHAGVFLVDRTEEYAVLTAASSAGGQQMLERKHRLRRGVGLVGTTLDTGEPRIALDVGDDAVWFNNPDLPDTRSELALPLMMRGDVIGVLDVQSVEPEAFSEDDMRILRTMADQLAVAIDNARLFAETQQALDAERRAYGELEREAWRQLFRTRPHWGYVSDAHGVVSLESHIAETASQEVTGPPPVELPVKSRDQVLGVFKARKAEDEPWTSEERELLASLLDQVGVALEGARLYRDTQRREARERVIREISDRMQQAVDMEALTRITAEEVRRLMGGSRVFVRFSEQAGSTDTGDDDVGIGGDEDHGG